MGVRTDAVENGRAGVIPVTYINSSAAIKAFVGEHGGIVCTSTNAAAIMTWAWERGEKLLMLPDQHLGRNTAFKMGVPLDQMVVWDPNEMWGGLDAGAGQGGEADPVEGALLGPHALHRRADRSVPEEVPGRQGHRAPECTLDVVQAADESGSTEYIINTVRNSPPGAVWAVATEIHLVNRLDARSRARTRPSSRSIRSAACARRCSACRRITCCGCSKGSSKARSTTRSPFPTDAKRDAKLALDRMLGDSLNLS